MRRISRLQKKNAGGIHTEQKDDTEDDAITKRDECWVRGAAKRDECWGCGRPSSGMNAGFVGSRQEG